MKLREIIHLFGRLERFNLVVRDYSDNSTQRQNDLSYQQIHLWEDCEVRFIMACETGLITLYLAE